VFESGDPAFAWAIGKALLIVIVSVGTLVCLAWAVTCRRESTAFVEIALKRLLPKTRHITR
jgi:hypothetical protein